MNQSRRNFLKQAGLGITATYLSQSLFSCTSPTAASNSPFANVGIQLYSLRDQLAKDPKGTLQAVAKTGFKHVETFGVDLSKNEFWGVPIADLKKLLSDNNLQSHSGHYDLTGYLSKDPKAADSIARYIEVAKTLGQQYIIAPVPPMGNLNGLTSSDYQQYADLLNKAGEQTKAAGIKIGYHNHFWEFRDFPNGTKGLDILLAFTEPDLVDFELDLYWVEKAGLNPLTYFEKYPGRFSMWHLKDMDKNFVTPIIGKEFDGKPFPDLMKEIKYTEVGTGAIDFKSISTGEKQAGLKFAFVEQDDIYKDPFQSIKESYDYVQKNLVKA